MDQEQSIGRTWLLYALLAAATLAAYWPTLSNDFVNYDDPTYVTENVHVLKGLTRSGAAWAFQAGEAGNWHPLTWFSHMLDVKFFGVKPAAHHAVSLLFHIVNSVLVFLVLRRMTGALWRCALVAALFALHPLHVESVAWVSERKDVLSAFFFLLTLGAYSAYVGSTANRLRAGFYVLALVLFALGLMSKPMLVTVPCVLLLLDFWPLGRLRLSILYPPSSILASAAPPSASILPPPSSILVPSALPLRRVLLEKVPFLALAIGSSVITYIAQGTAVSSLEAVSVESRIANALVSYVSYLGKTIWPVDLAVFYPFEKNLPGTWVLGAALLLAGLTYGCVRQLRRSPWLAFGWFWFLGTLVPVIGLVQVGAQSMADRYTYIPSIGLFIALAWAVERLASARLSLKPLAVGCAVAGIAACGVLTWRQAGYWHDSTALFEHAIASTKDNWVAHSNLGSKLLAQGKLDMAEPHLVEALRIKPNWAEALVNLGTLRGKQGRVGEGEELLKRAQDIKPTASGYYNLGVQMVEQGKFAEAETQYLEALKLSSGFVEARYNLGIARAKQGRADEAARDYTAVIQLRPGYADARLSLGALLAGQKKYDQAIAQFQEILRIAPDNGDAHFNLAAALEAKGDLPGAATHYAEACRLRPQDVDARLALGLVLVYQGRMPEAATNLAEVLRMRPEARAHYFLAIALHTQGKVTEALPHYREAVRLAPKVPLYLNDLAWLLATHPDDRVRDGAEAVRLAESACQLSGGKEARFWGTLDAAYAEAGRFDEAVATATKARDLAQAAGQNDIAAAAEQRLQLYRQKKPYRQ